MIAAGPGEHVADHAGEDDPTRSGKMHFHIPEYRRPAGRDRPQDALHEHHSEVVDSKILVQVGLDDGVMRLCPPRRE
jgi:hypothetical protein